MSQPPDLQSHFRLRPASPADLPALNALISASTTRFCSTAYTPSQIRTMIGQATANRYDSLISNSTYYVACPADNPALIIASGGWSPRRTVYYAWGSTTAAEYEQFNPEEDPAWIRGVYVHPEYARRGLARRVVRECEAAASRAIPKFTRYTLSSTMNAVPFYQACGYRAVEEHEVGVQGGETMKVSMMEKEGAITVDMDEFNRDVLLSRIDIR
ncbi:hypothetical protein H2202_003104 [Exophiala xenobiotica]|nr:hypothetical protein H2202_003104 [Exophiala xenobiotica]KAK5199844.1 hypothetical protein LTR92_000385 [Exophiala xenobiotica]KAK5211013.1 hypothetical protein LTR41_003625 [Exophiala xenobiotica]KAK5331928.1 hypothetical protein LTR93_000933 [Exophiala xenobiotica]KAK5385958.1 hypothetical protein LTS13_001593 [Exophiala xenobiotica]